MRTKKNVLVFTTWSFKDGLIQAATLPYLKFISDVVDGSIYLICLEQPGLTLTASEITAAKRDLASYRIKLILFDYHKNKVRATADWGLRLIYLVALSHLKRINYLHAMCTPAASLAWIVSLFKRSKIIADSFEPHAAVMAEMGIWRRTSTLYKFIFFLEKRIVSRAYMLLAVSKSIPVYICDHYHLIPPVNKIRYRPLCVDPVLFSDSQPQYSLLGWEKKESKIVAIYTGKIGGMYLDEDLCTFIKACLAFWKKDFHLIMCTAMDKDEVSKYFNNHGIESQFFTVTYVQHQQVPQFLSLADFGISFSRPSDARQYGCPTKNAEYWSMGLPIMATPATRDDTENILSHPYLGVIINEMSQEELRNKLLLLDHLVMHKSENKETVREFAVKERSFAVVKSTYLETYR